MCRAAYLGHSWSRKVPQYSQRILQGICRCVPGFRLEHQEVVRRSWEMVRGHGQQYWHSSCEELARQQVWSSKSWGHLQRGARMGIKEGNELPRGLRQDRERRQRCILANGSQGVRDYEEQRSSPTNADCRRFRLGQKTQSQGSQK